MTGPAARYLYFFWHRPRPGTGVPAYEAALFEFQTRLRQSAPYLTGLGTGRLPEPPFPGSLADLPNPPTVPWYEDWYAGPDWSCLERLNRDAVHPPLTEAHAAIARPSQDGRGGLYGYDTGRPRRGPDAPESFWCRKPEGLSYENFHAALDPLLARTNATLWRRVMVLAPAPEFLITSDAPLAPLLPWPPDAIGAVPRLVTASVSPETRHRRKSPRAGLFGAFARNDRPP